MVTWRDGLRIGGGLLLAAGLAVMLVVVAPQVVGADQSYVVVSGSMAPTFQPGDVVLVEEVPPSAVEEGDVITFERDDTRMTHRVVEVVDRGGVPHFRTQGDANEDPDQQLVSPDQLQGRAAFTIPYVGHLLLFARTDVGIAVLVILPATLLVATEVWTLARALGATDTADVPAEEDP